MEFKNIISLVPQGEHFDASAVNEGVWLTEGHLANIENHFETITTAGTSLQGTINDKEQEITSLKDQLAGKDVIIGQKDTEISALQQEVERLKAGAATTPATTVQEKDDLGANTNEHVSEVTKEAQRLYEMRTKK